MKHLLGECDQELEVKFTPPQAKSRRAELIKYFHERLRNKDDKPFSVRFIAIKLSHLKIKDLDYLVSVCKDVQNRRGKEAMQKFFWWSIKGVDKLGA